MTDLIGLIGGLTVIVSLMAKDIFVLRTLNTIACVWFIAYGMLISSMPIIFTNIVIIGINVYYLVKQSNEWWKD